MTCICGVAWCLGTGIQTGNTTKYLAIKHWREPSVKTIQTSKTRKKLRSVQSASVSIRELEGCFHSEFVRHSTWHTKTRSPKQQVPVTSEESESFNLLLYTVAIHKHDRHLANAQRNCLIYDVCCSLLLPQFWFEAYWISYGLDYRVSISGRRYFFLFATASRPAVRLTEALSWGEE
jgi:hypothetical protein